MGAVAFVAMLLIWGWYTIPYPARAEFSAWFWTALIAAAIIGSLI